MKNYCLYILLFICSSCITACGKNKLLENNNSSTIKTLALCQSLLNNKELFSETPVLGEISSDSYYIDPAFWNYLSKPEQNAHTWQVDIFEGQKNVSDYSIPYAQVYIANEVLAALPRIITKQAEQPEKNHIAATAYFLRANAFYNLLQLFARPYESATALSDNGIVLPLKPDINTIYSRASIQASYDQVITDLLLAKEWLTNQVYPDQPSRPATEALLARVFLSMRDYHHAGAYADSCLQHYDSLMNYNTLDISSAFAIPLQNKEVLYNSNMVKNNGIILAKITPYCIVDTELYSSYDANDLRKAVFFGSVNNHPVYKASYTGRQFAFSGLATDEVYLIRAECKARAGDLPGALQDINALLVNRFKAGTYQPYHAATPQEALQIILEERRKELIFRGLRFTDLRRLNREGAGIQLSRMVNGKMYRLPPNDLRYTLPIPDDAIAGSLIVQNPRQ